MDEERGRHHIPRQALDLNLDVNLKITHALDPESAALLVKLIAQPILNQLGDIVATQQELAQEMRDTKAQIEATTAQNEKARAEIIAKIKELEDKVAQAGNTSPEVDAAFADLKTAVGGIAVSVAQDDDMNPDAQTPPGA